MEYVFEKDGESYSLIEFYVRLMRIIDFFAMILGFLGTGIAIYEHELFYDFSNAVISQGILESKGNDYLKTEPDTNLYLRLIVTLTSILLCILIFIRYIVLLKLEKVKGNLEELDTLCTSKLYQMLLIELLYCIIHVPPRVSYAFQLSQNEGSYVYTLNMLIVLVMLGRIYLLWRFYIHYSSWNNIEAEKICRSCSCKSGMEFAVKAELKEKPYTLVAGVLAISIFIFGLVLRNFERPFEYRNINSMNWDYIWNGMWCIVITMSTVGYGDYFATTHYGRFVSVIACFWGTFLISLMVLSLTISSEFTPQESKSFNQIKKNEAEEEVKVKAANAIKFGIKLKIFLKKNPHASEKLKSKVINKFKNCLIEFRTFSTKLKSSEQDAPIELILSKLNDKVSYVLDKIKNDCYVYKSINSKLETSENNQKYISNLIEELYQLNELVISKIKQNK